MATPLNKTQLMAHLIVRARILVNRRKQSFDGGQ